MPETLSFINVFEGSHFQGFLPASDWSMKRRGEVKSLGEGGWSCFHTGLVLLLPGKGEKLGRGGWSCFHTGSVLFLPGKGEKATETGAIRRGGATATGVTQRVGATTAEVMVLEEEMAL